MRFQAHDGVQLFRTIMNIDTIFGLASLRNPEQPVEAHHVIKADDAGVLKLAAQ